MRELFIVTGGSRGLGKAMVDKLLEHAHEVVCIARSAAATPAQVAARQAQALHMWQSDLADAAEVAARLQVFLRERGPQDWKRLTLINNAAVLEHPGPLQGQPAETLRTALRVGLEAPVLLTRALLAASADWALPRRILNISSGLGRRPLAGVAAYCTVKAGLDHFSRALAEECIGLQPPTAVVALAPGIIDTGMQEQLRGADAEAFAAQPSFADFKSSGALDSPERAAARVLDYLARPDFGTRPVADVRD
jgi:benzil reductase ((S)-benzoin forming)